MKESIVVILRACILGFVLAVNSMIGIYIFPYLKELILYYEITTDENRTGYYAGFISGALFFGRIFSSTFWGRFADTRGRLPGLILSTALTAACNIGFTYTTNYYLGVVLRLIAGMTSAGMMIIGRTLTTEIAPSKYKSWTISICNSFWQFGSSFGAFVGGYYVGEKNEKNPFLVVGWITTGFCIASCVLLMIGLKETLKKNMPKVDKIDFVEEGVTVPDGDAISDEEQGDSNSPDTEQGSPPKNSDVSQDQGEKLELELIDLSSKNRDKKDLLEVGHESSQSPMRASSSGPPSLESQGSLKLDQPGPNEVSGWQETKEILLAPNVFNIIMCFSANIFFQAIMSEILSVWLSAEISTGGLGMNAEDIGNVMALTGPPQLAFQILLYPLLSSKLGELFIITWVMVLNIPLFMAFPAARNIFSDDQVDKAYWYLMGIWFIRSSITSFSFSAIQRVLNDSVQISRRGKVNALLTIISSVFQALGPAVGGVLVSWSVNNGKEFPLNYHFVFIICAIICVFVLILFIARLDKSKILSARVLREAEETEAARAVRQK